MKVHREYYKYDYNNGNQKPNKMLNRFKNWKTTLVAVIVAIATGLSWEHGQEVGEIIIAVVSFIALLLAKD